MEATKVTCPKCNSNVVPRLNTLDGSAITYATTQHICPICGVCMYQTGGEFHPALKYIMPVIPGILALAWFSEEHYTHALGAGAITLLFLALGFPKFFGTILGTLRRQIFGRRKG